MDKKININLMQESDIIIKEGKNNPGIPDGTGSFNKDIGKGMGKGQGKNKEDGCLEKGDMEQEVPVFFVKESLINEMKKDSLESYIKKVNEVVHSNLKKIVGEDATSRLSVLSTFKNHAIVADTNSNVYRLSLENRDGDLTIDKIERVEEIKKYTQEDLEKRSMSNLANALAQVVEKVDNECDNKFKLSFQEMLDCKALGKLDGFMRIVDISN